MEVLNINHVEYQKPSNGKCFYFTLVELFRLKKQSKTAALEQAATVIPQPAF